MAYGYKKRYGSRRYKRYGKSRRFKKSRRFGRKMKVPGGMKMVPSATYRTGGSYAVGQNAGHELKYLDSSLYNMSIDTTYVQAGQARLAGGGTNPSGTNTDGTVCVFSRDIDTNPIILNNICSGTDATQRLGRKVNIRSFLIRVKAALRTATGPPVTPLNNQQCVRVVVVFDKQANGQLPPTSSVFLDPTYNSTGSTPAGYNSSASVMQLNNRDRFVVLADEKANLSPFGHSSHMFEIRRNVNLETIYSATSPTTAPGATYAQIASGSLLVYFLGDYDRTSGGVWNPQCAAADVAQCRIRFYDA